MVKRNTSLTENALTTSVPKSADKKSDNNVSKNILFKFLKNYFFIMTLLNKNYYG